MTTNLNSSHRTGQLPWWLILIIVTACLGGGYFLVKTYLSRQSSSRIIKLTDASPGGPDFNRPYQAPAQLVLQSSRAAGQGGRQYNIVEPSTGIICSVTTAQGKPPTFRLTGGNNIGTTEQRRMLALQIRLRSDARSRQNVGLNAQQTRELNAMDNTMNLTLSEATTAALTKAWNTFINETDAAKQNTAYDQFLKVIRDQAQEIAKNTTASWEKRMTQFRNLLTPEQLKIAENPAARPATPRPATQPAAVPATRPANNRATPTPTTRPANNRTTPTTRATSRPAAPAARPVATRPAATPTVRPATRPAAPSTLPAVTPTARPTPLPVPVPTPAPSPSSATQPAGVALTTSPASAAPAPSPAAIGVPAPVLPIESVTAPVEPPPATQPTR